MGSKAMSTTCEISSDCTYGLTAVSFLNSLLGVMTTFGNSMILLVIYKTSGLQTNSNYLIASLAFADFSVGLIMNPLYAVKSGLCIQNNNHPVTVAAEVLTLQTLTATTYSLSAVSFDRYLAITTVLQYESYVTTKRCLGTICSVWIFSLVVPLPRLFVMNLDFDVLPTLWLVSYVIVFIIPLTGIAFCYLCIYKQAKIQAWRIATEHAVDRRQAAKNLKNRKAAWTAAAVIGVCFVLWLPSCITSFVQVFTTNDCLKMQIELSAWFWIDTLAFASSAVNPWIYFLRSREFKRAFKRTMQTHVLCCSRCWRGTPIHDQFSGSFTSTRTIESRGKENAQRERRDLIRIQSFSVSQE